ncbi:MAG: ExbD/TolR family protein [Bdellovibrionales bacterium]
MAKKTNEELNLTPFIGLFAMLVVMLLLTAVWNQVQSLGTNSTPSNSSAPVSPADPNKPQIDLNIVIMADRLQINVNTKPIDFYLEAGNINVTAFRDYIKLLKSTYPEKTDMILYSENQSPYKHLIQVFDVLVGNGFPDVGVSTN